MRNLFTTLLVFAIAGSLWAQEDISRADIAFPYMLRAAAPITVDGNLDEWAWAYPINHNSVSIPDTSRFRVELGGNLPVDDNDMSGTIYMMYDDFALYFAASVRDDFPGYTSDTQWASDAVEIYLTNFDINGTWAPEEEIGAIDSSDGRYYVQFNCSFNAALDSTAIFVYGPFNQVIETQNTFMTYQIWPGGDGYTLEGQIDWLDIESPNTGNSLMPTPGSRVAVTWSMYDIDPGDEVDGGANFDGWAYTPLGYAGWMGPGPGFQFMDVLDTPRGFAWEDEAKFDFVSPFIKKMAPNRPVTVDGDLSEWNYTFPADHWISTIPDSGRWPDEGLPTPTFDEDLKGAIHVQHDNDNGFIYFAASVYDNFPGWLSDVVNWQGDVIELYMANYDMGNALVPDERGAVNDTTGTTGDYYIQINAGFDAARDSTKILVYGEFNTRIETPTTFMDYSIWPDGNGYNIEGVIDIFDIESPTTGNQMTWEEGERVPFTWSLYDLDTTTVNESWKGIAYTPKGWAGWRGIGPGFQYMDIKSYNSIELIDLVRRGDVTVGIKEFNGDLANTVETFALEQNYPNPFNPSTNIAFTLNKASKVSLKIYNSLGQLVETVIPEQKLAGGRYVWNVDMRNNASGVYFASLVSEGSSKQIKMLLVK